MIDKGAGDFWWNGCSSRRPLAKVKTLSFDLTPGQRSSRLIMKAYLIYPLIDKEITRLLNLIVPLPISWYYQANLIWFWSPWFEDGRYGYWRYYPSLLSALRWSNCGDVINPFINAGIGSWLPIGNFLLYQSWRCHGGFVEFYLWKAVFDSLARTFDSGLQPWRISPSISSWVLWLIY